MSRRGGRSMKGERLVTKEPAGHWQTATLVRAVACDGVRAAMLLDGPMNSLCFSAFCQRCLAPSLQSGDLVMMDNLSAHKSTAALEAIHSAGADVLWLPPYSPDLAPVEKIISKVKENTSAKKPLATGMDSSKLPRPLSTQSHRRILKTASNPAAITSNKPSACLMETL